MLQVKALADASQLDIEVPLNLLQRDFLAAVTHRVIHFAKPTGANAALDRVSIERPIAGRVGEPSMLFARWRKLRHLTRVRVHVGIHDHFPLESGDLSPVSMVHNS